MDINKQCKKYILQTIFIFAVMNSIVIIVQKMWGLDLLAEMIVSSSEDVGLGLTGRDDCQFILPAGDRCGYSTDMALGGIEPQGVIADILYCSVGIQTAAGTGSDVRMVSR